MRSILIKESEIQISIQHLENIVIGASYINLDGFAIVIKRYSLHIPKGGELLTVSVASSRIYDHYIQQTLRLGTF